MTASALPLPQRPDAHSEQRPEQRLEFAPPKAGGGLPSALLALLAHLLLVAALTWGVQWKHQTDSPVIDAELWSAAALQAAPKAVAPPEPVPPAPVASPPAARTACWADVQIVELSTATPTRVDHPKIVVVFFICDDPKADTKINIQCYPTVRGHK